MVETLKRNIISKPPDQFPFKRHVVNLRNPHTWAVGGDSEEEVEQKAELQIEGSIRVAKRMGLGLSREDFLIERPEQRRTSETLPQIMSMPSASGDGMIQIEVDSPQDHG